MELKLKVVIDGVKTIEEMANRVLDEYEYKGRTIREWADRIAHPETNADLIRVMTDEEMAELFEMIPHSGNPATYTIDGFCIDDGLRTKRQWLDWLKQEAET